MKKILAIIIAAFWSVSSFANNGRCQELPLHPAIKTSYCVYKDQTSTNTDTLYFLHGIQGNVRSWEDPESFTEQVRRYWSENNIDAPTVVTFSYGPEWFLAQQNESPLSGLYDLTVQHLIPYIEHIEGLSGRRMMMGLSMGGVNTIQLGMKGHIPFNKIAVICAQMAATDAFGDQASLMSFLSSTAAFQHYAAQGDVSYVLDRFFFSVGVVRAVWPSPASWLTANPLELAGRLDPQTAPAIYLSAGSHDYYGNFEGNQLMASILEEAGVNIQWHPIWGGGHCDGVDAEGLARFLID